MGIVGYPARATATPVTQVGPTGAVTVPGTRAHTIAAQKGVICLSCQHRSAVT